MFKVNSRVSVESVLEASDLQLYQKELQQRCFPKNILKILRRDFL